VPRTPAWKLAQRRLSAPEASRAKGPTIAEAIQPADRTLLDVVDNLLNRGVLLNAELILALADVDLVYLRLSLLLAAADRVLGPDLSVGRRRKTRPGERPPPRGR
jgi:hypothetical protein